MNIIQQPTDVMKLLFVQDLRELQTNINEALVAVQTVTADPRTDTKLGKVGRLWFCTIATPITKLIVWSMNAGRKMSSKFNKILCLQCYVKIGKHILILIFYLHLDTGILIIEEMLSYGKSVQQTMLVRWSVEIDVDVATKWLFRLLWHGMLVLKPTIIVPSLTCFSMLKDQYLLTPFLFISSIRIEVECNFACRFWQKLLV